MSSAVRFALAVSAVFGAAAVLASLSAVDATAQAAGSRAVQSKHADEYPTDLSDRRRRRWRGYRRAAREENARDEQTQSTAENRCDARDMVQVDWVFIERVVAPIGDQRQHLTDLKAAVAQADSKILSSCAIEARLTPTGRLDAMEKRLEIRLEALKSLRAPLEAFYSALDEEQKARFVSASTQSGAARTFSDPGSATSETDEDLRSRRSRRR